MTTIKSLFDKIISLAYNVQSNEQDPNITNKPNGRSIWGSIEKVSGKDILLDDNNEKMEFDGKKLDGKKLDDVYADIKEDVCKITKDNEMNPKSNHFFAQLKNLVVEKAKYKLHINRLLQLAYNIGQLKVFIDNSKNDKPNPEYLNPKIFEHVQKYNLFDIDLYISPKTQEIINKKYSHKINEIIEAVNSIDIINPMEQSGGFIDEYHKYVKYKAKYMNKKYGHNIKQITKSMIKNKSQDGIDVHSKYVKYKTKYLNERNDDE